MRLTLLERLHHLDGARRVRQSGILHSDDSCKRHPGSDHHRSSSESVYAVPPNHKMVDVAINYSVTDNCTASSQVTCSLSVTSNEGTSADWVIVDAHHVQLRAERNTSRTYTITITCRDSSGNTSTTTVTVTVLTISEGQSRRRYAGS